MKELFLIGSVCVGSSLNDNYIHCKADRKSAVLLTTVLPTVPEIDEYQGVMWKKIPVPVYTQSRMEIVQTVDW